MTRPAVLVAKGRRYGYRGVATEFGLERHKAAFCENAIDADILRDMTDHDLEKLGVLLGDRRRVLRAIATLDGASAAASSPPPVPSAAAASPTSSTIKRLANTVTSPRCSAIWLI